MKDDCIENKTKFGYLYVVVVCFQFSDRPCPPDLQGLLERDRSIRNRLKSTYQAYLVSSKAYGTMLRGPEDTVDEAMRFLKVKYPDVFRVAERKEMARAKSKHPGTTDMKLGLDVVDPPRTDRKGRKKESPPVYPAATDTYPQGLTEIDAHISEDIMDYIYKVHQAKLDEIATTYGVRFHRTDKTKVTVRVVSSKHDRYLEEAFSEFEKFYQIVFFSISSDTQDLQDCSLPYKELVARIKRVGERYPRMLLAFDKEQPIASYIKFYGSAADVEKVGQLLGYTTGPGSIKDRTKGTEASEWSARPVPTDAPRKSMPREDDGRFTTDEAKWTYTAEREDYPAARDTSHMTETEYATRHPPSHGHPAHKEAHGAKWTSDSGSQAASTGNRVTYKPPGCNTVVEICPGNILDQNTEAIVNAADSKLQHFGGVALAISKAAGFQLQSYCNQYIQKHGALRMTDVLVTKGYDMRASYILHAVGPHSQLPDALGLLRRTCSNILQKAHERQVQSVAIPALSTGKWSTFIVFGTVINLVS